MKFYRNFPLVYLYNSEVMLNKLADKGATVYLTTADMHRQPRSLHGCPGCVASHHVDWKQSTLANCALGENSCFNFGRLCLAILPITISVSGQAGSDLTWLCYTRQAESKLLISRLTPPTKTMYKVGG